MVEEDSLDWEISEEELMELLGAESSETFEALLGQQLTGMPDQKARLVRTLVESMRGEINRCIAEDVGRHGEEEDDSLER